MKKSIHTELNRLAAKMPLIFIEESEIIAMSGADLNLTPLGDAFRLEKDKYYQVPVPLFRAVEHKQQLKDAFKRSGMTGVRDYVTKTMQGI